MEDENRKVRRVSIGHRCFEEEEKKVKSHLREGICHKISTYRIGLGAKVENKSTSMSHRETRLSRNMDKLPSLHR